MNRSVSQGSLAETEAVFFSRSSSEESLQMAGDGVDLVVCYRCGQCIVLEGNEIKIVDATERSFHEHCFDAQLFEELSLQSFDKLSLAAGCVLVLGGCVLMTGMAVADVLVGLKNGTEWVLKSIPRPSLSRFLPDRQKHPFYDLRDKDPDYQSDGE